jgi:hypothetical protein
MARDIHPLWNHVSKNEADRKSETSILQNDLRMRAAFSHSRSRVAGQKASRCTRPLALAAAVFNLDNALEFATDIEVLERLEDQPKRPALEPPDDLLSHEGRKEETRCMAGRLASPSPPSWPGGGTTERTGIQGALLVLVLLEMIVVPERKWTDLLVGLVGTDTGVANVDVDLGVGDATDEAGDETGVVVAVVVGEPYDDVGVDDAVVEEEETEETELESERG